MANLIIDVHCSFGATPLSPTWNDGAAIRQSLLSRGIGTAFLSSKLAARYDPVAGNDGLAQVLGATPEGVDLRGWLVLHPDRLNDDNGLLRKHLYGGDNFVGAALYCDPVSYVPITLQNALEVITLYRRFTRPLLIETRTADAMREAVKIAQEVGSTIKVIASGMGGDDWRDAIDLAAKPLNLFLDISGALSPDKIEYALTVLGGARRLLFASGAPDTDPAAVLGMMDDVSGLTSEDRDRILFGNAQRIFGLTESGATAPAAADAGAQGNTGGLAPLRPM